MRYCVFCKKFFDVKELNEGECPICGDSLGWATEAIPLTGNGFQACGKCGKDRCDAITSETYNCENIVKSGKHMEYIGKELSKEEFDNMLKYFENKHSGCFTKPESVRCSDYENVRIVVPNMYGKGYNGVAVYIEFEDLYKIGKYKIISIEENEKGGNLI